MCLGPEALSVALYHLNLSLFLRKTKDSLLQAGNFQHFIVDILGDNWFVCFLPHLHSSKRIST